MYVVSLLRFCQQAVTALQDTSINLKQKEGTRKHILVKHLAPGSYLVSFSNERNCLGFGTLAGYAGLQAPQH